MRRPHFRQGSFANVTAIAALVIATSGSSAYAAHLITSKQIKNNTIKSIDVKNGTLTNSDLSTGAQSSAYSKAVPQTMAVTTNTRVVDLLVPEAGSYVITATLVARNFNSGSSQLVECTLAAGGDTDHTDPISLSPFGAATLTYQVVHTFGGPGTATLTCTGGPLMNVSSSRITAIKVARASAG